MPVCCMSVRPPVNATSSKVVALPGCSESSDVLILWQSIVSALGHQNAAVLGGVGVSG